MAADVPSRLRRDLGEAEAHQQEALRQIERMGRHRCKEPSLADADVGLDEEDSKVIRDAVAKGIADGMAEGLSAVSIAHHESTPPSARSALSIRLPWNIGVSAHGRVVWLVAILATLLALAWMATRSRPPAPTPVLPAAPTLQR